MKAVRVGGASPHLLPTDGPLPQGLLDHGKRQRSGPVLECLQLQDIGLWQEIRSPGENLAQLDERGSKLLEGLAQLLGPLTELLIGATMFWNVLDGISL